MIVGLAFTFGYIVFFKFYATHLNNSAHWWFGISPEGIGMIGAILNFTVAWCVALLTEPPPSKVLELVENIRLPSGVNAPYDH